MWLEHRLEDSATLIVAFQVQGRLAAIAKPLPNKYVPVHLVYVHVYIILYLITQCMHVCTCGFLAYYDLSIVLLLCR